MPFFSVIIPLYNKESFIENTLKSILCQTFTDFEIIIINDGSTDKSEEKVFEFKDSRIQYFYKENGGVSSARNYGIEKAQSNYLSFVDADDYWYPHFLKEMHNNISTFQDIKVFTTAIEIEISKKVFFSAYSIEKTGECEIVNYFDASCKQSVISGSSGVFHNSVFTKTGGFDLQLKSGEDIDMWIRIGLNYPILFSWKVLVQYVYDDKSLSRNYKTSLESIDFSKFTLLEKSNPDLKKFLDLNRFSLAIKSKILNDKENFLKFYNAIDFKKLSLKKRILLKLPASIIKLLIDFKLLLAGIGLGNSVFK